MRRIASVTVALLASLVALPAAQAATRIWTGGSGGAFGTAANWGVGGAPGSLDIAQFSSNTSPCTIAVSTGVAGIIMSAGIVVTQATGVTLTVSGDFNQSNGTFNGGDGTLSIGGDLLLSVGTFNATSGLTQIAGAFNKASGNFNHNSGRVLLNSTGMETLGTNLTTFNHLYINDGMMAYWPFEELASPSLDSSGWGRNATWANTTNDVAAHGVTNFTNARSLGFGTAANDYATFTPPDITATTVTAWVYSTSRLNTFPRIMETPAFQLSFTDNTGTAPQVNNALSWTVVASPAPQYSWRTATGTISDLTWYHVAVTFNGVATATAYINGVSFPLTQLNAPTGVVVSNTTAAGFIGNRGAPNMNDRDWNGYIDDLRIYKRVLSAAEIADIYSGSQRTTPVGTQSLNNTLKTAGDLVIASGTLDVTASGCGGAVCAIQVGGDWLNLGGAFTPRTGTVTFNGTGAGNVLVTDRVPFNKFTISGTGTWTMQDRLFVDDTLTISAAGTLAQSSGNYDIHTGNLTKTAGTISGAGDVVLDAVTSKTLTVDTLGPGLRIESPLETGLVGYWKLDEGRGTTAYDVSGSGNNGTLTSNPIWSSSVSSSMPLDDAGALAFNGTSQWVNLGAPTVLNFSGQITMAAWVNFPSSAGLEKNIVAHGFDANTEVYLRVRAGGYEVGSWTTPMAYYGTSYAVPVGDLNAWVHVTGVYDGTTWRLYRNGTQVGATAAAVGAQTVAANWAIGAKGDGTARWWSGSIDDVRIYNRALSANEVSALFTSGYTIGSTVAYGLGANAVIGGALKLDSGDLNAATFSNAVAGATTVNGGEYLVSSSTAGQTFTGGLTVNRYGTLTLASSGGKAILGSGSTLSIDGTLNASSAGAIIQGTGTAYDFRVGTALGATPTLNINGLQVRNTSANGMYINSNTGATTTFTRFDNIAFGNGPGTAMGNYNLRIYAPTLNLTCNGCSFDSGVAATVEKNVFLAGNGSTGDSTETRVIIGGATCALATTCEGYDGDDDNNTPPDGVGDTPASNGGVVQWVASAQTDTSGSIEGFPTAAFTWTGFTYYATYVAYNDTNGTSADTVFVRNASGTFQYSWTSGLLEDIIGAPRWDNTGALRYVFVATTGGKVYRLIDSGSTLITDPASPWSGAAYDCSCTITTPLAQDTNNLYWGGIIGGVHKLWTLSKTVLSPRMPAGSPMNTTASTSNTAPAIWVGGSTFAFLGLNGRISKVNTSTQVLSVDNVNPGTSNAVTGRITIIANKLYAGDDNGYLWSLDPDTNFDASAGTYKFWGYHDVTNHMTCGGVCQIKSHYFDPGTNRVAFGDQDGHIYTVNSSGAQVLAPWRPGPTMAPYDAFTTAPLYQGGVMVVGTTTGTLYIIDGNSNGTIPAKIQTYKFGPATAVSGVGYDPTTSRYMVSTANASSNDGKLYFIAAVGDPTTGFP